jgi:hypothetical protein
MTTTSPSLATPYRTHTAGALRAADAGTSARLSGWVHRRRDHGHLIFLDLRDRHGITQVVIDRTQQPDAHAVASRVRSEFVITAAGDVERRLPGTENAKLPTGEVELRATEVTATNAQSPPSRTGTVPPAGTGFVSVTRKDHHEPSQSFDVPATRPSRRGRDQRGVGGTRWRVSAASFVWWVALELLPTTRKGPEFDKWLHDREYEGLFTNKTRETLRGISGRIPTQLKDLSWSVIKTFVAAHFGMPS